MSHGFFRGSPFNQFTPEEQKGKAAEAVERVRGDIAEKAAQAERDFKKSQFDRVLGLLGGIGGEGNAGGGAGGAIQTQRDLLASLMGAFENFGRGAENRIEGEFEVARNNAIGGLASRGFAGSSLTIPAETSVARDKALALGALQDNLLGRQIDATTGIAKNVSDLQIDAGKQRSQLLSGLLGSLR